MLQNRTNLYSRGGAGVKEARETKGRWTREQKSGKKVNTACQVRKDKRNKKVGKPHPPTKQNDHKPL